MSAIEIKVPEGVWDRFVGAWQTGGSAQEALTAALQQLVEDLLGDEAMLAAWKAQAPDDTTEVSVIVEAALRSVGVLGGSR